MRTLRTPHPVIAALALLWSVAAIGCFFGSDPDDKKVAGGGVRTTNGEVAGRIKFADATPAQGMKIRLFGVHLSASGVDKQSARTVTSDAGGAYKFTDIPNGRYAMTVVDEAAGTMGIMPRLVMENGGLAVVDVLLSPPIVLQGRILPPAGAVSPSMSDYRVCLPGLGECVAPGPDSVYTFPKAPQGEYELVFIQGGTANYLTFSTLKEASDTIHVKDVTFMPSHPTTRYNFAFYASDLPRSLHVLPTLYPVDAAPAWYAGRSFDQIRYFWLSHLGKIEPWHIEDYMDWKHRQSIPLRVSVLDASTGVQGLDFPYFVRLDPTNFDFSKARTDGRDIRFASESNRRLDYHIMSWNSAAQTGEIWVRIDTLYGANTPATVWMYAGKSDITYSQSFAYTVLNREAGYAPLDMKNLKRAAWFLDDNRANSLVKDQRDVYPGSYQRLGQGVWNTNLKTVTAVVGRGLVLDGIADHIAIDPHPTLDYPGMSISLWARNDMSIPATRQYLAVKAANGLRQWHLSVDSMGYIEFGIGNTAGRSVGTWKAQRPHIAYNGWHHYAATFSAGIARVYFNGAEIALDATGSPPPAVPAHNGGIAIGINPERNGGFWQGQVDHFTYDSQVYTPNWVKLSYESQRP